MLAVSRRKATSSSLGMGRGRAGNGGFLRPDPAHTLEIQRKIFYGNARRPVEDYRERVGDPRGGSESRRIRSRFGEAFFTNSPNLSVLCARGSGRKRSGTLALRERWVARLTWPERKSAMCVETSDWGR